MSRRRMVDKDAVTSLTISSCVRWLLCMGKPTNKRSSALLWTSALESWMQPISPTTCKRNFHNKNYKCKAKRLISNNNLKPVNKDRNLFLKKKVNSYKKWYMKWPKAK